MKTFIVYVRGVEVGMLKAANLNAAERKAQKAYPYERPFDVWVAYTEV